MRLATQLTIAFGAITLLSLAPLTFVAREVIGNRYRQELQHTLDAAATQTEHEYEAAVRELERSAGRLLQREQPFTMAIERARTAAPENAAEARSALSEVAAREARARGLDVLLLVDEAGEVWVAPADPGREGARDPALRERVRAGGARARVVEERPRFVKQGQGRLALEVVRELGTPGRRGPWLVVGDWLDEVLPEQAAPSIERVVRPGSATGSGTSVRRIELEVGPDQPPLVVELRATDRSLRAVLRDLSLAAVLLALGGVALAMVAGAAVARLITRPIGELAEGADAVAKGQRDLHLPERGGAEIAALTHRFNEMISALATAEESALRAERAAAWRQMAQHLAHELKNPLTPIQMSIETLKRTRARPDRAADFDRLFDESAQVILDEVARLKTIVGEFSRFARLPAPQLQAVDVADLCEGAARLYEGAVPIVCELGPGLPRARADRDQLQQVLVNLLENAREAVNGRPAPRVILRAEARGDRVLIAVIDNGPGIDASVRDRLFAPYATSKPGGTGLGLALVQRIVSEHGGTITVSDGLSDGGGPGAAFLVELPTAT